MSDRDERLTEARRIGELIHTQDNRITDQPLFIVERKRKDFGYQEGYSDTYEWVNRDDHEDWPSDLMVERLDALGAGWRKWKEWEKCWYNERWEFVTACFTEQGCKDYISRNGHNLGETRIYADGSYRNHEYQTVRKLLLDEYLQGM